MYTKALRQTALLMSGLIMALTTAIALGIGLIQLGAPGSGHPMGPVTGWREVERTPEPTLAPTPTPTVEPTATPTPEPTPTPTPEPRSVRIRAVGDLMVHQTQLDVARREDGSYDFHPQYARVAGALADADYTIANLETTIGRRDNRAWSGFPCFNTPESLLDAVKDAGVDFLTLANNHIVDRGFAGLQLTVDNVERWGFDHAGANRTPEEKERPVVVDAGGVKVGMLCYTEMTNGMEKLKGNRAVREYGVNYLKGADFAADVDKLREAGAEVVFALPHWGAEYTQQPIQSVEATARKLVAAGVDVVIGSHPHMVQPVTWVEAQTESGQTRRGLVAYSMGNFISNMSKRYTDCGILLDFTLKERASGGFDVTDVKVMPTFCWRQPDVIQTLPALDYYDAPPEGMTDAIWQRLREGVDTLRKLIPDFPMIGVTAQPAPSQ